MQRAEKTTVPAGGATRARGRPKAWHDKTEQNTIKALDRALVILQRLGDLEEATLTELAADLDQSPATLYRVLTTLQSHDFATFDETRQVWSVGAGAFLTGAKFLRGTSLVERARPFLRRLMEATGETANLGVAKGHDVLFLSQAETDHAIRAFFPPGTLSPMHASGIGKALLAQRSAAQIKRMVSARRVERFTEHTLTTAEALIADAEVTRDRGYALDGEEKNIGMRCIAAPVFDVFGEAIAGLSISGPVARITDDRIDEIGAQVRHEAAALTAALGGAAQG
ncbi:HTH-type transcriptional regulator BhcR [Thalassorhabdomicrobium marinisediminis]|uniref:IclR family transcriptional regulator n=1 Tax=Thalassorhabdomicrobium marinisediminis TaxID=2170577 RepID=A0A2T7FWN6_9RHOB|nr:HTH-type transcriptional regulator BhcR [Thalassorhabdomicrobium marinisediminis]PVA06583.1 IclR family transcriptional regulator [Thalassorhabdomicrobium marinisediminis]